MMAPALRKFAAIVESLGTFAPSNANEPAGLVSLKFRQEDW